MDTGVYRWGQLCRLAPKKDIELAIADGMVTKLRHGWYSTPAADKRVEHAVRIGGVVSCATALEMHGVWVPAQRNRLHVRGNDGAARTHPLWCRQHGRQPREFESVDDMLTALRHAARCLPPEDFVVVCDSIVNKGLMDRSDLIAEFVDRSAKFQRVLDKIDGRAESGIETMVRLRLQALNIHARPQVRIPMVGRVDLLIGTSLIIETDGVEFHSSPDAGENDKRRDSEAHALGFHTIRLTYRQVTGDWAWALRQIRAMMRRGEHRRPVDVQLDSPLT
ncbi:endonuclease domain-containing protein [Gordonia humi]|uniref:Very-short-patch-repair endonuclease n=1 Tax=Gordonia humi TaxID=686429 RepID=A0A840F0C1_9ACTN|nr:hypothetical protein [Gordonia humi]MBB4135446.1 very-short-patch-repair endonuclease [Gordonia humi]